MDDNEVDPAMLEAMGFTAFGAKPGKKRNAAEAFVDPNVAKAQAYEATAVKGTTKAVSDPMLDNAGNEEPRIEQTGDTSKGGTGKQVVVTPHSLPSADAPSSSFASAIDGDDPKSLDALKNGVPNQYGDMVYFLPDFLEDPWQRLRK